MEVLVENLGKVHSARIALNGVTVITGPNGSGKSTIGIKGTDPSGGDRVVGMGAVGFQVLGHDG